MVVVLSFGVRIVEKLDDEFLEGYLEDFGSLRWNNIIVLYLECDIKWICRVG